MNASTSRWRTLRAEGEALGLHISKRALKRVARGNSNRAVSQPAPLREYRKRMLANRRAAA